MIYFFEQKTLTFKKVSNKLILIYLMVYSIIIGGIVLLLTNKIDNVKYISEETKSIIIKENNKFSKDKLKEYILDLNIKFPHIVYAQAILESGDFKSNIFKTNNNLFGMKVAKQRPTTNKGEQDNHAIYDNWRESVQDYAMFSAAYLNDIKTEEEYFAYLKANYAEDTTYITKVKTLIKKFVVVKK